MVDVIVYKPSGYTLGFIIYHAKQERVYELMCLIKVYGFLH